MPDLPFFDCHVHPSIKPYGQLSGWLSKHYVDIDKHLLSHDYLSQHLPEVLQALSDPGSAFSLWHQEQPNWKLNKLFGELAFAKFTQSDLTTAFQGHAKVMCATLYPIEKEFLKPMFDQKLTKEPYLKSVVTGVGEDMIKYVQSDRYKYFQDLEAGYEYLKSSALLDGPQGQSFILASDYSTIEGVLDQPSKMALIPAIEGANVFYPTKEIGASYLSEVLENIQRMKAWEQPPLYVSLAHHFYNGFVSHERSLTNLICVLGNINQTPFMNQELSNIDGFKHFTREGVEVLHALLSSLNGRPVIVDVKHMDHNARKEYYNFVAREYSNSRPVFFSHAAVGVNDGRFNTWTINLNDVDIDAVWRTNGLIGVELDQRVLGFKEYKKYLRKNGKRPRSKGEAFNSELLWNSIEYIAMRCALNNQTSGETKNPWSTIAIGSDFDGLINPINQFPTLSTFASLEQHLVEHAERLLNGHANALTEQTTMTAKELVRTIMFTNGMNFLRTWM